MSKKKYNKKELVAILVDEYGYDNEDLKDDSGKPLTNAVLESMIEAEEQDREASKLKENVVSAPRQIFKDEDLIVVMNGLEGALVHTSTSTGRTWRFQNFGQTEKIPYGELLSLRNRTPKVFDEGWMIILNKQIQEDFGLTDTYENIITPDNIDTIFNKDADELEAFVESLPKGMKTTFVAKARQLYESKKLDSLRVIEFIESYFQISLNDNAPLSDIAV